ncbi:MAG: 2TM domain-containing protein [Blastococcus sp.]
MSARDERPTEDQPDAAGGPEDDIRRRAIRQIERRRRFHAELVTSGIGMLLLVVIWATTEYQNAGGWPTDGFSQSSSIPNVWNVWIIYPVIAWVLVMTARAWTVYGRRPISDDEIRREIERQNGTRAR